MNNKHDDQPIDVVHHLSHQQLKELIELANEPDEKDTLTMAEFLAATDKWRRH